MHDKFGTLTNLMYFLFAGILIFVHNEIALGIMFSLVGLMSTGFHWTRSKAWHLFDLYAIMWCFMFISMWLAGGIVAGAIALWCAAIITYFLQEQTFEKQAIRYMIGIAGFLSLIAHWFRYEDPYAIISVLVIFTMAFFLGLTAEKYFTRRHRIYDTFHGFWHILTSYGMYILCVPIPY